MVDGGFVTASVSPVALLRSPMFCREDDGGGQACGSVVFYGGADAVGRPAVSAAPGGHAKPAPPGPSWLFRCRKSNLSSGGTLPQMCTSNTATKPSTSLIHTSLRYSACPGGGTGKGSWGTTCLNRLRNLLERIVLRLFSWGGYRRKAALLLFIMGRVTLEAVIDLGIVKKSAKLSQTH